MCVGGRNSVIGTGRAAECGKIQTVKLIVRVPAWPLIWLFRLLTGVADWASAHARILPFGSAIGTFLVANLAGDGEWAFWHNWDAMMAVAGLGVIAHGIAAVVLLEGGVKVGLYVVDKWRADRAKMRNALRVEVIGEVRQEVLGDVAERLSRNPDANPLDLVAEMRRESGNDQR